MRTSFELYSEEFNNKIKNIVEEEGYIYKKIVSSTSKSFYKGKEEEIIEAHITHIAEDYAIEYELELVTSNGYIKNNIVYAELLMRKKGE